MGEIDFLYSKEPSSTFKAFFVRSSYPIYIVLTRKPTSRVFLAPPEGLTKFLSSLYHAWQLLLAKFFDLVKLEFWTPGPPEPPGGQGSNLNSLFRALRWEGFALSIWFGYYKRFPRTLKHSAYTDKPKSTRKYLFDLRVIWLAKSTIKSHSTPLIFWL